MGKATKITVEEPNPKARFHLGVFTASMPLCVVCAPLGPCLLPRALRAWHAVLFDALRCAADLKQLAYTRFLNDAGRPLYDGQACRSRTMDGQTALNARHDPPPDIAHISRDPGAATDAVC